MSDSSPINFQRKHGKRRFVAIFDILGFSDFVKKHNLQAVIDVFENLKKKFNEYLKTSYNLTRIKGIHFYNFSDTYLLYSNKNNKPLDFTLLLWACDALFNEAFKHGLYMCAFH